MTCTKALKINTGDIVAIVGCNGKTSLLHALSYESPKVLLSTTTHIYPPARFDRVVNSPEETGPGINLAYGGIKDGKLFGLGDDALLPLCPKDGVTLLECDGSRSLPFKGWGGHEPVVPRFTTLTVGVFGLWRVGEIFSDKNVFNPQIFSGLTGAKVNEPITMEHAAKMISDERGMFKNAVGRRALLINTNNKGRQDPSELAALLPVSFKDNLDVILAVDLTAYSSHTTYAPFSIL